MVSAVVRRAVPFVILLLPVVALSQQPPPSPRVLVWVDRAGAEQATSVAPRLYSNPRISPDGRRLAVTADEGQSEHIFLCDLPACASLTKLTTQAGTNDIATWTPDGQRISYNFNPPGSPAAVFVRRADGSGMPERLTAPIGVAQQLRSWSPNGLFAATYHQTPATGPDIWLLRMADRTEFPFLTTPAIEGGSRFSPDNNWLAYMSTESGTAQIYIQELPGDRRKRQISTDTGVQAVWNPAGGELFYRSGSRLMAVPITTGANFSVGQPRVVFDRQYWATPVGLTNPNYDVSPDGQRFLMIKEVPGQRTN